jgi:hypothetical protein
MVKLLLPWKLLQQKKQTNPQHNTVESTARYIQCVQDFFASVVVDVMCHWLMLLLLMPQQTVAF